MRTLTFLLAAWLLGACGDRCSRLCREASVRLDLCNTERSDWDDLGARSRTDFVRQCRADWDRTSADLTPAVRAEAQDVCQSGSESLDDLDCDAIRLLYGL